MTTMNRRDEVERIIRDGFADMTTPASAVTVTNEHLAEMLAGLGDTPSHQSVRRNTMRSILTELAALRSAPATEWQGKALSICDGIEQPAFEKWATAAGYDMHEHPMHYLFLNERTDAARMGWKAGIQHALDRLLASLGEAP